MGFVKERKLLMSFKFLMQRMIYQTVYWGINYSSLFKNTFLSPDTPFHKLDGSIPSNLSLNHVSILLLGNSSLLRKEGFSYKNPSLQLTLNYLGIEPK